MNAFPGFNPLDYGAIAESIERRFEMLEPFSLGGVPDAGGSGIYAIWYRGKENLYSEISGSRVPIYVGRAEPRGGRTGGLPWENPSAKELRDRLLEHAESTRLADNLEIKDFSARGLVVPTPFIRAAERFMISLYGPPWNVAVEGFGKHAPGRGRSGGRTSWWDTVHPGRDYGETPDPGKTLEKVRRRIKAGIRTARENRASRLEEAK